MCTRRALACALTLALSLLAACSSVPTATVPTSTGLLPPGHAPWTAEGKIALRSPEFAETASFRWRRHSSDREQLRLSGPFGIGAVDIHREGEQVYWLDEGEPRPLAALELAPSTAQLVSALPMDHLGDWLLGSQPSTSSGWQQEVLGWQTVPPWRLPRSQRLSREDVQLRVFISDWRDG